MLEHTVKTKFLGGGQKGQAVITNAGAFQKSVPDEWVPQDAVRIIGAEIISEFDIDDALTNQDTLGVLKIELTRAGHEERDGVIMGSQSQFAWNAAIATGSSDQRKREILMFPSGYGIDVDKGEVINLWMAGLYSGAIGTLTMYASATIYYVER